VPVAQQRDAPANPHFSYHAQTVIGGTFYDPSYGSTGRVAFDEVCPPYSEDGGEFHYPPVPGETLHTPIQQQGAAWPPPYYLEIPYLCAH